MSFQAAIDEFGPAEWSDACSSLSDYNIYQTWAFGEISAADTNSTISRMMVRDGQTVIGAAQLRIKRLPILKAGLAYLYFGPLTGRATNPETYRQVLDCIRLEFLTRRKLGLRIAPALWSDTDHPAASEAISRSVLPIAKEFPPYRTMLVKVSQDLDHLRRNLEQKWRNGLNQSEKRGLIIEKRTDDAAMQEFEELYETMWNRKQFETGVTVSSFRRLQELLPPREKLTILLARREGALAAGHVSSTLGDTCVYLLGASNDLGRECKASYALQWQAIMGARSAGATWYDLGGIDPHSNPGVFHFKAGLGGKDVTFAGTFEAQARGLSQFLVPFAERAFRAIRSTRKSLRRQAKVADTRHRQECQTSCPTVAKLSS